MNKLKLEFQRRLRRFLPQLLIVLTAAVVWGHTVRFEFVWDDKFFIERLESIRSFKSIPEIFTSLAAQSSFPEGFVLFRPLRTVHYALLFQLGGGEPPKPWLFHLANVVWHGAAAVLFYSIALILFGKLAADEEEKSKAKLFALFTALAFTVNPVVSETVCWAKSLDDLMATAFTLAATLSLLRWSGDRRSYVLALGWFLLAVYSKISAVPFALFSFLLFYYFQRISFWRACRLASGFLAIALLFMVHNHLVVGRSSQTAPISGSYGQTLIDMLPVVPKYIRLLFGIPPFFIDYTYLKGGNAVLSAPVVTGLVLLLGIAAFCVWGLLKRGFPDPQRIEVSEGAAGREARAPKFLLASQGLIWVGMFLLPVSNLLPMMQYMAERFLYLPLVGWLIALASLIWLYGRWRFALGLFGVVLLTWAALAWNRSWIWRDDVTLFVQSSQAIPQAARVKENAVAAIFELPHVKKIFMRDPQNAKQFIVADTRSVTSENWASVIETLTKAHDLYPDDENVLSGLGIARARTGNPQPAIHFFQLVAEQHPEKSGYWANLGQACAAAKQFAQARQALDKALELDSKNLPARHALASVCWQQNDFAAALQEFEMLQQLEPSNAENRFWIEKTKERLK